MGLREKLRRVGIIRMAYNYYVFFLVNHFMFRPFRFLYGNLWFWKDYFKYSQLKKNEAYKFSLVDIMPFTDDKTQFTPLEPIYFFQDCWLAKKIFENRPIRHYDVGSNTKSIGLISQFVKTTMVDIRPIELKLDNLEFVKGSILDLPFSDNQIGSISSICVIEHIGLGRYGDPLDTFGSEKSIYELQRVTSIGGNIYITVPVEAEKKILFNGQRLFTPEYIKSLFGNCELVEEKYIYGKAVYEGYKPESGYGVGMFAFRKIK